MEETDLEIVPDKINGLKKPSLIRTDKLATLEIEMIIGKIGSLKESQLHELDAKLKQLFDIN